MEVGADAGLVLDGDLDQSYGSGVEADTTEFETVWYVCPAVLYVACSCVGLSGRFIVIFVYRYHDVHRQRQDRVAGQVRRPVFEV